ncbi:MAG: ferrochelatase, partial [Spirochaetota bacterium]
DLDEIDREYREVFEENGGGSFRYIPALNDRSDHIEALARIAREAIVCWLPAHDRPSDSPEGGAGS